MRASHIASVGLFLLHRVPFDKHVASLILKAREVGALTLFDADDLIFDESALECMQDVAAPSRISQALYRDEIGRYREAIERVDAILVSSDDLAMEAAALRKPAWVHRNCFSLQMLAYAERARRPSLERAHRVVIGYAAGTPTHDRDLGAAKGALQQVLREYPASELCVVGPVDLGNGWGKLEGRIRRAGLVPWRQLPEILAQFDVNIAPLDTGSRFCRAKSEAKYIEAGLVGVPTIASRTGAFAYAIRSGENGLLAESDQEWVDGLRRLVGDARFRRDMGERARADVMARYHPVVRVHELISTLNEISQQVRGYRLWPSFSLAGDIPQFEGLTALRDAPRQSPRQQAYSLHRRALYALQYRGVRVLLMQAWVYLHRRIAHCLAPARREVRN